MLINRIFAIKFWICDYSLYSESQLWSPKKWPALKQAGRNSQSICRGRRGRARASLRLFEAVRAPLRGARDARCKRKVSEAGMKKATKKRESTMTAKGYRIIVLIGENNRTMWKVLLSLDLRNSYMKCMTEAVAHSPFMHDRILGFGLRFRFCHIQ